MRKFAQKKITWLNVGWFNGVQDFAKNIGYNTNTNEKGGLAGYLGTLTGALLALLGIVFTGLIIYAGILWMTAQGAEEQVKKAKKTLINSVIGLALIILASAIYAFVFKVLGWRY